MPDALIIAQELCAGYGEGALREPVLVDASFEVPRGGITAIVGPSGSGKTTLLSLLGGLDVAESGRLTVDGVELSRLSSHELGRFRLQRVGFVFQAFHLIAGLTAVENVRAGLEPLGLGRGESRRRALGALDQVGLSGKSGRFPHELSGGEQQRVAVARACAKEPPLLLADEPTGNLDAEAGEEVLQALMRGLTPRGARSLVIVTHEAKIAGLADRCLELRDHRVRARAAT